MNRFSLYFLLIAVITLIGCNPVPGEEPEASPELKLDKTSLSYGPTASSNIVSVTSNQSWTVSCDAVWVSFNTLNGQGSRDVSISVSANDSFEPRTATVRIGSDKVSATLTVNQKGIDAVLNVKSDKVDVPEEGGTYMIDVDYNVDFEVVVEDSADWISFVETKATASGKLVFEVAANENFDTREGKVTVKDKSGRTSDKVITFSQKGIDAVLNVKSDKVDVPEEGGSFMVDVEYNVEFEVTVEESAAAWIEFVETKATASGKMVFNVAANESVETREGKVTIKDKTGKTDDKVIIFSQKAFTPVLAIENNEISIPFEAGSYMVDVQYNVDFTVTVDESASSWLAFVETKAVSSGTMIFEASKNDTMESREGKVTVTDPTGRGQDITFTIIQAGMTGLDKDREVLMTIYAEMGGNESWTYWGSDSPVYMWRGVVVNNDRVTALNLGVYGVPVTSVKGCVADLTELEDLFIEDEKLTGPFPAELSRATNLRHLNVYHTSYTGDMPDIFADMQHLTEILFYNNEGLTGTLPESIGHLPELERVSFVHSSFTGNVPDSWFERDIKIDVRENFLSGKIPTALFSSERVRENFFDIVYQRGPDDNYTTMDLSEIPYLPYMVDNGTYLTVDGETVVPDEIIKKNKYTALVHWGVLNPYSEELMNQVKALYERYHDKGLEVIAINSWDEGISRSDLKEYITAHGYDKWINVDASTSHLGYYPMVNPAAEVLDQDMHVIFTYEKFDAPCVKGFQTAVYDLSPFLRTLFGDMDPDHVSTDYSKDGEVVTLQKATVGKGINLVLMGDAYVDTDMAPGGHYETIMKDVMEQFFSVEPYKSFRDRFNVYIVKVVSKNCQIGEGMETTLKTEIGFGRSLLGNVDICMEYAEKVPSITSRENLTVITMVNNLNAGATNSGLYGYNSSVAFISTYNDISSMYSDIVIHEAGGHGFAHLADEYQEFIGAPTSTQIEYMKTQAAEKGWWANIDFTDDPAKVKWAHFLTDSRYKDSVGIFKGGNTYTEGVWRPSEDSWMNKYAPYFNAPSREAIYKRIMLLSGEEYSFEKFAEYDKINR